MRDEVAGGIKVHHKTFEAKHSVATCDAGQERQQMRGILAC